MEDDDFLALSDRQRRAIDRAFDRGLRYAGGRAAKRRRLETSSRATPASGFEDDGGGGFIDDGGGGFVDDGGGGFVDDGGGGFMDEGGGGFIDDDTGGGFMDDPMDGGFIPDTPTAGPSNTNTPSEEEHIPLRLIPQLLGALSLPSDEDVLNVFRASATGWGEGRDDGIVRKDFRAVCAALMGPDDGEGEGESMSSGDDGEAFAPSDDSLSDEDDDDYGAPSKGKGKATRTTRSSRLQVSAAPKLTTRQKEQARLIWDMLKPDKGAKGAHILGWDEVKHWARELGEMWTDAEITDMVALFSSQHEGRGLSFDDFGVVMMRAGMV